MSLLSPTLQNKTGEKHIRQTFIRESKVKAVDESKILKKLKAGDEAALGWFIERYTGYVSSIVHSLIGQAMSQADIEEVTADVFLSLWEGREKVRPGKLRPWLSAVARHRALNRLRQRHMELPFEEDILVINSPDPESECSEKELAQIVRRAVDSLPYPEREIFLRHYYYGQKVKDIARQLGINESTVKTKLRRGREALGRSLQEGGGIDGI